MANVLEPSDAKICCKCAGEQGLKGPYPCTRHPDSEGEESSNLLSKYNHYLYNESLSGDLIRLLQLEPGVGDEPLKANLIVRPLNSDTAYTALSYTWGDPTTRHEISCHGQRLYIRENLHSALLQFRQDGRMEPLWIDAICINQKNNEEKTAQVRKMRDIYETAVLVICWLGEQETSDEEGFSLMRKLYTQYGNLSLQDVRICNFKTTDQLGLPDILDVKWKFMCRILYRPYFFRIWIVQEIIVARRCLIQCGTHIIDRTVIFAVGAIFVKFHFVKESMMANIPLPQSVKHEADMDEPVCALSVRALWDSKATIDIGVKPKIYQLLMSTRAFKATEPLDKIYALISLCSDVSTSFIDYDKRLDEVQIDIAKRCMMSLESWGSMVFSYVCREHHCDSLPSWVPDWTSAPTMVPLAGGYYDYRSQPAPSPGWHVRPNNQIVLKGRLFGEVATVIHHTPYMIPHSSLRSLRKLAHHSRKMEEWEESAWELASILKTYPTKEGIFDAYWRALIFNKETIDKEPSQEFSWAYKNWITTFAECKDESLVELVELLEQPRPELDPPPTSLLGKVQRFASELYTQGQLLPARAKLAFKYGLLANLLQGGAPFQNAFCRYAPGRKFCTTTDGYVGWVPSAAQTGDVFCFFEDCKLPFVLRSCEEGYQLVGDAYLHGLMYDPFVVMSIRKQEIIVV